LFAHRLDLSRGVRRHCLVCDTWREMAKFDGCRSFLWVVRLTVWVVGRKMRPCMLLFFS
jgi:hypothetical protein